MFRNIKIIHKFKKAYEFHLLVNINIWIKNTLALNPSLNLNKNVEYVFYTKRINQDCLKNLVCTCRQ